MTTSRALDPKRLDVAALAGAGAELDGEWPAERLARLMAATLDPPAGAARAAIAWRVRGERRALAGAGVRPSIELGADTDVSLVCQRCLQPMNLPLRATRRIFFVDGEDAAVALDAETDDDVLALAPALDLTALIEDELLLALPLVPRHEVCPEPLPRAFVDDDFAGPAGDNPFAALAVLKRGSPPN